MKRYYTYKNERVNVGDTVDIAGRDYKITNMQNNYVHVENSDAAKTFDTDRDTNRFSCIISPNFALYDRITGQRIRAGHRQVLENGTEYRVAGIYDDVAKIEETIPNTICDEAYGIARLPVPVSTKIIWIETVPTADSVRLNLEMRREPRFSELEQLHRETVEGVVHVRALYNRLVAAEHCIYIENKYRLLDNYLPAAGPTARLVKKDSADLVLVMGDKMARASDCITLTAGRHVGKLAYIYDVHTMSDGRQCMLDETVLVRTRAGEERFDTMPEDTVMLNGHRTMSNATRMCTGTQTLHWILEMQEVENEWYSNDYANAHFSCCDECGNRFFSEEARASRNSRSHTCSNCRRNAKYRIRSYSNRDSSFMKAADDVKLKFGIELEVGCDKGYSRSSCAKVMIEAIESANIDATEYVTLKEDGSLSRCEGFEVVTRPDSPAVHKRVFEKALSDTTVKKYMTSWTNGCCGIHIHVSRAPLSALWIGRILVFMNSKKLESLVHKVAGRTGNQYTQYIEKRLSDGADNSPNRYEAVNTLGEHTIEFRIFRGTLAKDGFIKNIEFVEAVLEYTRPATRSLYTLEDEDAFRDFVCKSRKSYPSLYAFLNPAEVSKAIENVKHNKRETLTTHTFEA